MESRVVYNSDGNLNVFSLSSLGVTGGSVKTNSRLQSLRSTAFPDSTNRRSSFRDRLLFLDLLGA